MSQHDKPQLFTFRTTYRIEGRNSATRNIRTTCQKLDKAGLDDLKRIIADEHRCDAVDVDIVKAAGNGQTYTGEVPEKDPPAPPSIDSLNKATKAQLVELALSAGLQVDPATTKIDQVRAMVIAHFYPQPKTEEKPAA